MKLLLGTTMIAGLMIAGAAQAADMPLKAPPRAAPYYSDWTGFYVFGFGGYSWGRISPDDFGIEDVFGTGFHNPKPKGGVFGFGGVASAAAGVARILFFIAIVVFLIFLIMALL